MQYADSFEGPQGNYHAARCDTFKDCLGKASIVKTPIPWVNIPFPALKGHHSKEDPVTLWGFLL